MRATSLLRIILRLHHTRVLGIAFNDDGIVIDIAPTWRVPRCGECHRPAHACHDRRERTWRHLDLAGMQTTLRYTQRRVTCAHCGVRVEQVPWADPASGFTKPFENQVGFLAQRCDRTTVTRLMRIAWRTVGRIIERVVARDEAQSPDRLDGLRLIGVDELSYRKHHKYITIVTDQITGRVVWSAEGKNAETLGRFFAQLGPERCAMLEGVTLDLSGAFIKAVKKSAPQAKLIFDRFHIQKLVHEALDEVRRELARTADAEEKKTLKGTRYALHKRDWNLSPLERGKLEDLEAFNKPLYRAYLLKEMLVAALDRRQPNVARDKIIQWLASARDSGLAPFQKAARTIGKHIDGVIEYIRTGLSNGRIEGLNGKARTLTRRAYGFHSAASLISLLFLCCGGIHLDPSHVYPYI